MGNNHNPLKSNKKRKEKKKQTKAKTKYRSKIRKAFLVNKKQQTWLLGP